MPLTVVCIKLTTAEIIALDSLAELLNSRSRSETILLGLRKLKPTFGANPFNVALVKSSRSETYHRAYRRKPLGRKLPRQTASNER